MSKMDFNRAPYFDDFDPSKNQMKVLMRPGRPVQARELNTMQSIAQNQIEQFANHIFKNGSRVSNARAAINVKRYVRLQEEVEPLDVAQFPEGTKVVGTVTGITATMVHGTNATDDDPATIFVVFTGTAIDGESTEFLPGETISFLDENGVAVYSATIRCPGCGNSQDEIAPIGNTQFFTIDEGVFYYEGMFIWCQRQQIVINKYVDKDRPRLPMKIGLDMIQKVVDYVDDPTLLDPSLGYPNSTAPGADRYVIELRLVKRTINNDDGDNFILLCRIGESGSVDYMKTDSEYADIMDMLAKRTYEQAGNYTIRPFRVSFKNHKKESPTDAHGYALNGDDDRLIALVTPSVAYVKGYRVETISDTPVAFNKARDTEVTPGFIHRFNERTNILMAVKSDAIWPNDPTDQGTVSDSEVLVYDGPLDGSGFPSGSLIGNFKVNDISYVSGDPEDNTAIYRYFIYDINMAPGRRLNEAQSFYNGNQSFSAEPVINPGSGQIDVNAANDTALLFRLGRNNVKTLRDADNNENGSISFSGRLRLTGVLDSNGRRTFTSTTNQFFHPFNPNFVGWASPGGAINPLNLTAANFTIDTTTLTIDVGPTYAGQNITIFVDALFTNQKEKTKTIAEHTPAQPPNKPDMAAGAEYYLGKADVFDLVSVTIYDRNDPDNTRTDVTADYELVPNITDYAYRESYIRRRVEGAPTGDDMRLAVTVRYFNHIGTSGYFTIDSYRDALNDPDSGITYETLPVYTTLNKNVYPVTSSFDFRPVIMGTNSVQSRLPVIGTSAIFDIEHYLGRADLLQIDKLGVLYVKQGQPSETPRPPRPDEDSMALYEIWLKPYTYNLKDISTRFIENKRYTMRDIGRIEKRLENVEYYTALNLLEKSAADMAIRDENGLDRFKNGFIADNFSDFQAGDITHPEFKAAVDRGVRELRPQFKARSKDLEFSESKSNNFVRLGNVLTFPYDEVLLEQNPYATKHISINPYFQFNKKGKVVLSPNNDVWSDETRLPDVVVDIDVGVEALRDIADAAGVLGIDWGSWIDMNHTILGNTTVVNQSQNSQFNTTTTTTTTTTQTQQIRTGTDITIDSRINEYTIEDIVRDVQIIPYIRESVVEFYATKMRANTRIYAFFDGQPVSQYCRDIGLEVNQTNVGELGESVAYGAPMYTDADGEFRGEFAIPGGMFFTGEKTFALSDDPGLTGDPDLESTSGRTTYFAGGLDVTRQNNTLNIITPVTNVEDLIEEQTVTQTSSNTSTETTPVDPPTIPPNNPPNNPPSTPIDDCTTFPKNTFPECGCTGGRWAGCWDPVAQSFVSQNAAMVTSLDIFLKQIDPLSDQIFVEIRNMVNGYPGVTVLGRREYTTRELIEMNITSDDSTKSLNVKFPVPIYIEAGTQYCFVVGGLSPSTRIWVAKLGEEVVNIPDKIVETPPTAQSSFRSVNGVTWNAEQFETIKFNLYSAKFATGTMKVTMENSHGKDRWPLEDNPIETQQGQNRVRIYARDHGFTEGDTVRISMYDKQKLIVDTINSLPPQTTQRVITQDGATTGEGIVDSVQPYLDEFGDVVPGAFEVTLRDTKGDFSAKPMTAEAKVRELRDTAILDQIGAKQRPPVTLSTAEVAIRPASPLLNRHTGHLIAGIAVAEFNKTHTVVAVDSQDSFIIEMPLPATHTGRFGGEGLVIYDFNESYDVFNCSGTFLPYASQYVWELEGIGHGKLGSPFEASNYALRPPTQFEMGQDRFLAQPQKIASADNEHRIFNDARRSITVNGTFTNVNHSVAPMINLDTFSIVTVSNRVEHLTEEDMNQVPNASGRYIPETSAISGSEAYKYVTRTVLLAQPASDLFLYFDVYKDINADFDVYVKLASVYETRAMDEIDWMHVDLLTKNRDSADLTDRIEYEIKCSELCTTWPVDDPFIGFKVKLVGKTSNSCKPPLFQSFRGIAVT